MDQDSAYVSTKEAAEMLGISLRTAQLWVENGVLIAWKTAGGHRRIMLNSVQQVLAERSRVPLEGQRKPGAAVVVVEDDPDLSELLRLAIQECSPQAQVHMAKDGFEGLILIGQVRPNLIITDLNMPGMDGFQMIRTLTADDFERNQILVITALSKADIEERGGLPSGMVVLEKPIGIQALQARVRAFLDNPQTQTVG